MFLCISFIFGNSMKNAVESTSQSGMAKMIVDAVLDFLHIDIEISEAGIRMMGHFAEFFILSLVLSVYALLIFPFSFKKPSDNTLFIYFSPIVISTLVAFIDEFIQFFTPGRACDIKDVLVDFLGATSANLIVMGIVFIIYTIRKRKD